MRQPITLKIKFKSASLDQFIERYSVDVSRGGIFIRTKEPLAVGTQLKFEFQLQDSSALISGEGTVVWTREHDPNRAGVAPGMGVRFDKVAPASSAVLDQILVEKTRRGEAQVESRFDAGVRASAGAAGTISSARRPNDFEGHPGAMTPLPKPAPGLEGAEEEFGNESTRVVQDDVMQRLAEKTRDKPAASPANDDQFSDEPTRARSAEEIEGILRASSKSSPSEEAVTRQVPALASIPASNRTGETGQVDALAKTSLEKNPLTHVAVTPAPEPLPSPPTPVAPPPAVAALPLTLPVERTFRDERPPSRNARSSSSALPLVLLVGVVGALGVGWFVFYNKPTETPPQQAQVDPVATPTPAPTQPATPDPSAPTANPATPTPTPAPVGPTIAVTSDPPGATVTVDGTARPEPTPTKLTGLDAGKSYDVTISLKGYKDYTTKLSAKEGASIDTKLVANERVVEVSSTPPFSDVFVDGKRVGRTPFSIRKFDTTKEHAVELRHSGYVTQTRIVAAGDTWEPKDGHDVLALALTLDALPKPKPAPVVAKPKPAGKPATSTAKLPTVPTGDDKPAAGTDTDKPADKPVAEKPASDKDKPAKPDDDRAIKTPSFMKDKPPASGEPTGEETQ